MNQYPSPWLRIFILLLATVSIGVLAYFLTGQVIPSKPQEALIFQNALLLIVLGSALLEQHYTKPADSVVNSLMGLITLLSVHDIAPSIPWWIITTYCLVVFSLGTLCVASSARPDASGWAATISSLTYRPAVVFGRARILFSIVFLSGLSFFYTLQDTRTVILVLFWGIFIVIWPLRLPELVTAWLSGSTSTRGSIGKVFRLDNPNIVRVTLIPEASWQTEDLKLLVQPNKTAQWILPLFSQFQEDWLLGTGFLISPPAEVSLAPTLPGVYDVPPEVPQPSRIEINEALGGGPDAQLHGYVVEHSTIGAIRFEALTSSRCHDGMLVWCAIDGSQVYYQVVDGETTEESFSSDKHGYRVATAVQLGTLHGGVGFQKFDWLPPMNTAVFSVADNDRLAISAIQAGDFTLGVIPNSKIAVGGDFCNGYNHHTAILGVTGSGKTELAFDLVRHAQENGVMVICIDLTAQYKGRLSDLSPVNLSIPSETAKELGTKLFEVETGKYGAPDEKKALNEFSTRLREDVNTAIEKFLTDPGGPKVGLIQLEEISNTKATLWITEMFMTCLLHFARARPGDCPEILIVVEEAHTVMPEPTSMGLGDYDSRGLVGKIAQIALQGRKYGVGLLILAQRTATVSKTVLTQCNTIISFTCFDDTSLGFLRNIFGPEHVALIPNLPPLHVVAFGKWIRAQRPIVVEIPYNESKAREI